MNTAQLLQRCQSGDAAAIDTFIQSHHAALYRLAYSVLVDPAEAEEAVQDALITALGALESYHGDRGELSLKSWLYTITLNTCRKRLRRRKALERLKNTLLALLRIERAGPTHPEQSLIQDETRAALWQAVCQLDEKHRLPVILYYYHDLPVAEIARVLRVREGTVHSRLYTARGKLRDALPQAGEPGMEDIDG